MKVYKVNSATQIEEYENGSRQCTFGAGVKRIIQFHDDEVVVETTGGRTAEYVKRNLKRTY